MKESGQAKVTGLDNREGGAAVSELAGDAGRSTFVGKGPAVTAGTVSFLGQQTSWSGEEREAAGRMGLEFGWADWAGDWTLRTTLQDQDVACAWVPRVGGAPSTGGCSDAPERPRWTSPVMEHGGPVWCCALATPSVW